MSDDLWWFLPEADEDQANPRSGLPFFEPTPPESFDEELEGLEFDNLDDDIQFPTSLDGPFPTYPDTTSTPSLSAYSTDLTEDTSNSEYSTSNYSSPFDMIADVDYGSEYNAVDPKHISRDIPAFPDSSTFFDSFGVTQFSAFQFQDVRVQYAKAQLDDGPYRPPIGISPDVLSSGGAFHGPTHAVPTDPPVGVGSAIPSQTGPMRTKTFVCSYCGHVSARKHNLKTHMDTHNPDRKKPFVCPAGDCAHPFTRKHDLKRHMESMHGDGAV